LLALGCLQNVAKKQVMIFAGVDGREELQTTLLQRGAMVTMVYLYQRVVPHYTLPLGWHVADIDISLTTSGQGLANFDQLINQCQLHELYNKPLIVINDAMIAQARQLGFKSAIIRADGASNTGVLAALQKEFK
jgi:uroporphyrinogen-III synthase